MKSSPTITRTAVHTQINFVWAVPIHVLGDGGEGTLVWLNEGQVLGRLEPATLVELSVEQEDPNFFFNFWSVINKAWPVHCDHQKCFFP